MSDLSDHEDEPVTPKKARKPRTIASPSKSSYSTDEDMLILTLKGQGLSWQDISKSFEGRSATGTRLHWSNKLKSLDVTKTQQSSPSTSTSGYSDFQKKLLFLLRDERKMSWKDMTTHFPGKSETALRLQYAKLKSVQHSSNI